MQPQTNIFQPIKTAQKHTETYVNALAYWLLPNTILDHIRKTTRYITLILSFSTDIGLS